MKVMKAKSFKNPERPNGLIQDLVDPGLGPIRVEVKTCSGIGPGKPG